MPKLELDHLIVAGPDLGGLVAAFAALTGARAVPGGRHAGQGTHNALVGLGRGRYLELLAPDPEQADGDFRAGIAYLGAPALHTWCARAGAADDVASRIAAAGLSPRRLPMARQRPGGVTLRWELVFADGHPYAGLLPFFIDWRGSPHPSEQLAPQLAWEGLTLAQTRRPRPRAAAGRVRRSARGGARRARRRAGPDGHLAGGDGRDVDDRSRRPVLASGPCPSRSGCSPSDPSPPMPTW
jgi:hypothetical protein